MGLSWIVVISFLTSLIAGVLAAWLVLQKTQYDSRRVYANQMHVDFVILSDTVFSRLYNHIHIIDPGVVVDVRPSLTELSKQSLRDLISRLNAWVQSDLERKLPLCDKKSVVQSLDILVSESVYGEHGFNKFFQKYPTQIVYFDKLYHITTWLDIIPVIPESKLISANLDVLRAFIQSVVPQMLSIIGQLKDIYLEIESFRKAKPWSWRIFSG